MIELLIDQASSYAEEIDGLVLLIALLVGFWFFVAQGVFFWLIHRFRDRGEGRALYITGEKKSEKRWINVPHALVLLCDVVIIVAAINVWVDVKQTLPEADATIRVIAQQWAWTFVHPGPDGELDTEDDVQTVDELHVELGRTYHYELDSRDVVHSFSVPVFRLKQDAVPGRRIRGWFRPTRAGAYDVQCAEICGIGHGLMGARIHVETAAQHAAWLERSARTPVITAGRTQ